MYKKKKDEQVFSGHCCKNYDWISQLLVGDAASTSGWHDEGSPPPSLQPSSNVTTVPPLGTNGGCAVSIVVVERMRGIKDPVEGSLMLRWRLAVADVVVTLAPSEVETFLEGEEGGTISCMPPLKLS